MVRRLLGVLLALVAAWPAAAQWRAWESDFDEDSKRWTEIQAQMPSYPKPENLVAFDAGAANPHRYFIDAASLSVGEDGVVRYALLVRTAGGATNVSFEGIRCETREQKYYASGRPDGSWVRARDPQWRLIDFRGVNRHHGFLYREFFCADRIVLPTARQIAEALRRASLEMR